MNVSEQAKKSLKYLQKKLVIPSQITFDQQKGQKILKLIASKNSTSNSSNIYYGKIDHNLLPNDQKGVVIFQNGDYYAGTIQKGILKGKGKVTKFSTQTGDQIFSYEGQWKNNLPHGKGTQKIGQNIKYKGDFVNGKKQGTGLLDFGNGTKYIGQFKNNQIFGQGKYTTTQNEWQGFWNDGYLEGKGLQKILGTGHNSNSYYDGNFKNGYKQGKGHYTWGSGKQYYGQFSKGQLHGTGKLKVGNKQFIGTWENGLDKFIKQGFKGSNIHMKVKQKNKDIVQ